jgi:hypothetical protein
MANIEERNVLLYKSKRTQIDIRYGLKRDVEKLNRSWQN